MKIALLSVDNRAGGNPAFEGPEPHLGTAPNALVQGFAELTEAGSGGPENFQVHIIACSLQAPPPTKIPARNIFYHPIVLPKWTFLRTLHSGPVLAVRRKLKNLGLDMVHAQGTERWCAISAVFSGLPKVLTIHGNLRLINKVTPMEPRLYWKLQEALETFSIPRFDGVVCITNYTRENVSDLARKTWLLPNAVERECFDLGRERLSEEKSDTVSRKRRILVVANIQARKNQNAFIDALRPLADEQDFEIRFFGDGMRVDEFSNGFFDRVDSLPWCFFGGMLSRQAIREEYRQADILVLPSLEDNCPMSVLEAMAAGIPVIAPKAGGVPDLIRDGDNGLLIDPKSGPSMQGAVERILRDPAKAAAMARKAYSDAQRRYHPRVVAEAHLDIYREVLEKHRKRRL